MMGPKDIIGPRGFDPRAHPGMMPTGPNIEEISKKEYSHQKKDEEVRKLKKEIEELKKRLRQLEEKRQQELWGFANKISDLKDEVSKWKDNYKKATRILKKHGLTKKKVKQ